MSAYAENDDDDDKIFGRVKIACAGNLLNFGI